MRKIEDVLRRAVCLLKFADRCAIEEKVTNGVPHTLNEREQQRKSILNWIREKDYYNNLTSNEKNDMETSVKNEINIVECKWTESLHAEGLYGFL